MTFRRPRRPTFDELPNLVPADHGDKLIATNVSPDGDAVALWATASSAESLTGWTLKAGARFANVLLDRPVQVRVTAQKRDGEVLRRTEINGFRLARPQIAALPDGQWLIAGSRCRWTPERVDPNAAVYTSKGEVLRCGILGDGISQLRTTAAGDIWVSYSDEGIFGNYGWGGPGPEPVGSRGLARFDLQLERSWTYPEDAEYGIDDGPLINIDGDDVWLSFFPHYSIVHITDGAVRTWAKHLGATPIVLVDSQRWVALVGGDSVTIGDLLDDSFRPTVTARLTIPMGTRANPVKTYALGPTLHVFGGDRDWWTTDVGALTDTG